MPVIVRARYEDDPEEKARIAADSQKGAAGCLGALVGFFGVVIAIGLLFSSQGTMRGPTVGAAAIYAFLGAPLGAMVGAMVGVALWQRRRRPK